MTKSDFLQIRISPDEKRVIAKRAQEAGLDMSTWVLQQVLPPPAVKFQALVRNLSVAEAPQFALAELNDFLAQVDDRRFLTAAASLPDAELTQFQLSYLAAMVECAAHSRGLACPDWTGDVAGLETPYFTSSLRSLRLHLLVSSPPPFRRRNIFIDSTVGQRV